MEAGAALRHTPLYDAHVAAGARLVAFAGWEMPVQYAGVGPEHRAVREDCGVFDVSHMGEIETEGPARTTRTSAKTTVASTTTCSPTGSPTTAT